METVPDRLVDPEAPKVACVYKITGPGGKLYIGKTVVPLKDRKRKHAHAKGRSHPTFLSSAIRKHGRGAFTIKSVLIEAYGTHSPRGYNISDGGEGMTSAEAQVLGDIGRIRGNELLARRAGYPGRRVLDALGALEGVTFDSLVSTLDLTKQRVRCAINHLRIQGHHIIREHPSGLYRLVTLEEAADHWASGRALSNHGRALGYLMKGRSRILRVRLIDDAPRSVRLRRFFFM